MKYQAVKACPNCASTNYDWKPASKVKITLNGKDFMYASIHGLRKCADCGLEFHVW